MTDEARPPLNLDDWRVLRNRKWDHHDQHLIVRPYVDTLVAEIESLRGGIDTQRAWTDIALEATSRAEKAEARLASLRDVILSGVEPEKRSVWTDEQVAALVRAFQEDSQTMDEDEEENK